MSYPATNEKNLCQAGQNRLDTGPHSEPPTGIDPVTSFLPRTRSTTELGGQRVNTLPEDSAPNKSAAGQVPEGGKPAGKPGNPGPGRPPGGSAAAATAVALRRCDEANTRCRLSQKRAGPCSPPPPR